MLGLLCCARGGKAAVGPVLRWTVARGSFTRVAPAKAMPARRASVHPSAPAARRAEGDDCSRLEAANWREDNPWPPAGLQRCRMSLRELGLGISARGKTFGPRNVSRISVRAAGADASSRTPRSLNRDELTAMPSPTHRDFLHERSRTPADRAWGGRLHAGVRLTCIEAAATITGGGESAAMTAAPTPFMSAICIAAGVIFRF